MNLHPENWMHERALELERQANELLLEDPGQLDDALELQGEAASWWPDNPALLNNLAVLLSRAEKDDESQARMVEAARLIVERWDEIDDEDASILASVGTGIFRVDEQMGLRFMRRGHEIDPDSDLTRYNLCRALNDLGMHDDALPLARDLVRSALDDPDSLDCLAETLFGLGLHQDALPVCRRIVELDPHAWQFRQNLAVALLDSGLEDDALELMEQQVREQPSEASCHALHGVICAMARHVDQARHSQQRAVELDDGSDPMVKEMIDEIDEILDQGGDDMDRKLWLMMLSAWAMRARRYAR